VFELAALADKEKLPLKLILLGGFSDEYGRYINLRANQFESTYCRIETYNINIVDQDEFDRQMDLAQFVFIPSVVNTKICGDIPEIYGITKSSGNIFDVIKHAKPFIAPSQLSIPANLQTSCFKYKSVTDIIDFFKKLISSPGDYNTWREHALENSKNYTLEKVRERNASLFNA
ncbi:MAG TPA: hypothetical protein VI461_11845, partial [Chitinophagaceae bacterium]|nr:hypothetical protein [Chitinophagaceae bacterium]